MELLSPPGLPHAETASPITKAQKSPVNAFGLFDTLGLVNKLGLSDPPDSLSIRVLVRVDVEK